MRKRIEETNDNIITDRNVRDNCVGHYEVLEKVKKLLLLPGTELMSIEQVASYYEVSPQGIKDLYTQNKSEIDSDGTTLIKRSHYDGSLLKTTSVVKNQTSVTYSFNDGQTITINNRGLKAFSKRAVLRIGMILQQSQVARSVRDQLLNIEEKTDNETKTTDITEEQKLMLSVGMAYASGDINAMLKATTEYNAFQNRHIEALETDNGKLVADNKALAEGNLEWSDRSQINYAIRRLSGLSGVTVQKLWGDLYNQLLYKFHMNVRARGKQPWIQHVEEHEWNCVNKVFSSMCNSYGLSASEILEGIKVK